MKMIISVYMKESVCKIKKIYKSTIFIALLVIIDQLLKSLIVNNLYKGSVCLIPKVLVFTYLENKGGAYGIASRSTLFIIIFTIIIILGLAIIKLKKSEKLDIIKTISLDLIIAGGLGNLIDRILRGFVIDYIDVNQFINFPIFNFADCLIVIGCSLLIIKLLIETVKQEK